MPLLALSAHSKLEHIPKINYWALKSNELKHRLTFRPFGISGYAMKASIGIRSSNKGGNTDEEHF
jgi:hypothetical protein